MLKEEIINIKNGYCDFTKSVDWSPAIPIGSLYLASILKNNNHDVHILDLHRAFFKCREEGYFNRFEKDLTSFFNEHLTEYFKSNNCVDIAGLSCLFNVVSTTVEFIAALIKKLSPKTTIIAGGHYPTNMYKEIMPKGLFDYIILGEAEEQITWLSKNIKSIKFNELVQDNPYIVDQKTFQSESKQPASIAELDVLPFPILESLPYASDYLENSIDSERVGTNVKKKTFKSMSIFTSRGCPMKCTFCASHKVHGRKVRFHSIDYMINYIEYLVDKYEVNNLLIQDDMFNYSKKRAIDFCNKLYHKYGDYFNIEFPNGLAVWNLDEELILGLKKVGLKAITIAVESGNEYVQKNILKKNLNLNIVKQKVELVKKHNIGIRAFYVIGFIGETISMMQDTINFALDLDIDWSEIKIFTPLAGSEMYELARKKGYMLGDTSEHVFGRCAISTPDFSAETVKEIQYDGNIRVNFLNNKLIRNKQYKEAEQTFKKLVQKVPNHFFAHWAIWIALKGQGKTEFAENEHNILKELASNISNAKLIDKYNIKL